MLVVYDTSRGDKMNGRCPRCGRPFDWRGPQKHHRTHKGMGGRKLRRESYKVTAPVGVSGPTVEDVEADTEVICARCHIDEEHSGGRRGNTT